MTDSSDASTLAPLKVCYPSKNIQTFISISHLGLKNVHYLFVSANKDKRTDCGIDVAHKDLDRVRCWIIQEHSPWAGDNGVKDGHQHKECHEHQDGLGGPLFWGWFGGIAGTLKMLGLLPVSAQESHHIPSWENHETNKKDIPDGQQSRKHALHEVIQG